MGRILGKIEDGLGVVQYLIHCNTSGLSFPPLFDDPHKAWAIYQSSGSDGLYRAVPAKDTALRVVLKTLSPDEAPQYALATKDRLVRPFDCIQSDNCFFVQIDGALHLAESFDNAFLGYSHSLFCDRKRPYNEADEVFYFHEYYGKPVSVCPHCVNSVLRSEK